MSAELTFHRVEKINYEFKASHTASSGAWIKLTVIESDGNKFELSLFGDTGKRILVTSGEEDD